MCVNREKKRVVTVCVCVRERQGVCVCERETGSVCV